MKKGLSIANPNVPFRTHNETVNHRFEGVEDKENISENVPEVAYSIKRAKYTTKKEESAQEQSKSMQERGNTGTNKTVQFFLHNEMSVNYIECYQKAEMATERNRCMLYTLPLQVDPTKRELVVNWMMKVQIKLRRDSSVMHLSVILLDELLRKEPIKDDDLQIAGAASFLLAWKFLDGPKIPHLSSYPLQELSQKPFPRWWLTQTGHLLHHYPCNEDVSQTRKSLLYYERKILRMNDFNLIYPNAITLLHYHFMKVYQGNCDALTYFAASYFLDIMLLRDDMMAIQVSVRVVTSIFTALSLFHKEKVPIFEDSLDETMRLMVQQLDKKFRDLLLYIRTLTHYFQKTTVYKKYAQEKFSCIAKHPIICSMPL